MQRRNLLKKSLYIVQKVNLKLKFSPYGCRPFQLKGENFLLGKAFQDLS